MIKATDIVVTRWGARFLGRRFPCAIGKGGITDHKREGDGASPRAVLRLMGGGFRKDRILAPKFARPAPFSLRPIGPRDLWSDDPKEAAYNHAVSAPYIYSHEKLCRADPLYDVFLITDWNWPDAIPGKGSAIFVHHWRKPRHPTEGCVAFRPDHLGWILQRVTERTRLILR